MYPGNTEKFQKAFARATKNPYGYLFVGLKPFTSENDRLRYDLTWIDTQTGNKTRLISQMPERQNRPDITSHSHAGRCETIKEMRVPELDHSSVGFQGVHIDEEQENTMADKAKACDDCGLLFDSGHDVQRHVKSGWCSENREPPAKRAKTEEDENEMDDDLGDNKGYRHTWDLAQSCSQNKFNKLYDQFIDDGENEYDATDMAEKRMQPYKEKNFFDIYQTLLETYWLPLMTNATHLEIVQLINEFCSKEVSLPSAVKRVLKKKKIAFEDLVDLDDSEESEEDESEEEDMDSQEEFQANKVQSLMRKYDVRYFPTQNETKASTSVETILTIKRRLYRYFTHNDSYSYLPVLQDIAYSYNRTYYRTIGMPTSDVTDTNQEVQLATYVSQNPKYAKQDTKLKPFKFTVGNYVRISHLRNIHKRYHRGTLPIYRLRDLQDEEIKRTFDESELQKITFDSDQTFKIDKIEKTKGKGKHKQYFVKWKYE
ncbi:hypothetical protein MAR_019769 [Mya arenaria]|uniref:C2H2-type domain-containing protein n=1 Tax=Mya arenaria TaxID=6604 RepID=A0ABY7E318_MYAAR|nr:hypothetical protein MAR_019769 [Mya arenaria]